GIAAYMTLKGLLGAFRVEVLEKVTVTLPKGQDLPALLGVNRAILAALIGGALIVFAYWSRQFRSSFDYTLGGVVTGLVVVGGVLMGFGGITALGCTIGQGITGFSTLALGSIITFVAIVAGSAATMKYQYWRAG